jgi:gamma-glutamyl:cysteine ligase YbdK (ATP-grasp superfamily)
MDSQSTVTVVAPLVALIRSLARLELERDISPVLLSAEVLTKNRFLAAGEGMQGRLIDPAARSLSWCETHSTPCWPNVGRTPSRSIGSR